MKKQCLLIFGILLGCISLQIAHANPKEHEKMPVIIGSAELQKMKSLVGRWEGTHQMGEKIIPTTVIYEVTSNGSAVLERLSPDTADEMVSVYHDENNQLTMTHYCSLGNQPKMDLVESTQNSLKLDFSSDNSLDPAVEDHMHGLTIVINDETSLTHEWTMFKEGQVAMTVVMNFSKVE